MRRNGAVLEWNCQRAQARGRATYPILSLVYQRTNAYSGQRRSTSEVAKLNSDAAFDADSGQSWAGVIARDHRGHLFLSVSKELPRSTSVEEAEGRATLPGLHALAAVYMGKNQLEVDNKWIPDALKKNAPNKSLNDALATFSAFKVTHSARGGNKMAHELVVEEIGRAHV